MRDRIDLFVVSALVLFLEAWLWEHLAPVVGWVVARIPLRQNQSQDRGLDRATAAGCDPGRAHPPAHAGDARGDGMLGRPARAACQNRWTECGANKPIPVNTSPSTPSPAAA